MINNKTFYPTPSKLISKMWTKVKNRGSITKILEPSAGQGHIVEWIKEKESYGQYDISCIEIDSINQAVLKDKKFKVIDSDFLAYAGTDRFDLIIANFPFDDGLHHLNKAIDIMFSGQIICLLNAETIKNSFSNERKALVQRLQDLNAEIDYIQNAFKDAERKTEVEVALIYINIERNIEDDFFQDCKDKYEKINVSIEESSEIISANTIDQQVEWYNNTLQTGIQVIYNYYKNYNTIGNFIKLNCAEDEKYYYLKNDSLNAIVNDSINKFVTKLRKSYWKSILNLEEIRSKMTEKKIEEFNYKIEQQSDMDFTQNNIRTFILNLIGSYENTMIEAVSEIFDKLTVKHCWLDETSKNVHYFNGWKTNRSFYCNKKVILPIKNFISWSGSLQVSYDHRHLDDIDKVMNYFDSNSEYVSILHALEQSFKDNITSNVDSTYFKITVYKKGTIHLTFKSEDIRRRFNVIACKHKKWLPDSYGKKEYPDMNVEEQSVVEEFEGRDSYNKNLNQLEFVTKTSLRIC